MSLGKYSRREFIKTGVGIGAAAVIPGGRLSGASTAPPGGPLRVVASGNGLRAADKAMSILQSGGDPLDAVIAGVNIVEDDPDDMSVGYGGLPNADGVVELDSSVMYGPTHSAGAVGALQKIKNPSKVARLVMEETPHVLLVGEGALRFALAHGFEAADLLTEKARQAWLLWKKSRAEKSGGSDGPGETAFSGAGRVPRTHGTINCLALDADGRLAGVTTTSGLSYKLPGRVGDSPIIGAGLYVDNAIGAAGSTGLGEANLMTCASFQVVDWMGRGFGPEEACLKVCGIVAAKAKQWPRFHDPDGRPNFGLSFYALDKKGRFGSASLFEGAKYAVNDGAGNGLREAAYLFKAK